MWLQFNHIIVLYEDLRTCCLNVSLLGGSLTKVESLTVANFTRNLFRSIWHRFDFPAVGSPFEHGWKDGKCGLELILFEDQMSSDFLQDPVCTCKGRSVCSKGCVCFEQNLSCTELCPCQALDLCRLNVSSLGGSLTKVESLTVANFTRSLFRSIWHRFDFPFGSYSLDISFRLRSTELSTKDYRRYIPIHELCKSLSSVVCAILPADYALTGCDTTSSFFGIGKKSMLKAL
jgi:hypothetical protein